tara:strand:+ start:1908 stop:2672 length:765 start_codon:yes stop_codon:yes gene_type:complete
MTTLNLTRTDILTIIDRVDEARKINNDFDIDLIINSLKVCNDERMDFISVWNPEKKSEEKVEERKEEKIQVIDNKETAKQAKLAAKEEEKKKKLAEKEAAKQAKLAAKEEEKKKKLAEKEAAKQAKLASKEEEKKKKLAEKEQAKQAKLAAKKPVKDTSENDNKGKRGRPKKEHHIIASGDYVESIEAQQVDLIEKLNNGTDDSNEEDIQATLFEFDGTIYYKSDDHVLYDKDTQDEVGVWDPIENEVIINKKE